MQAHAHETNPKTYAKVLATLVMFTIMTVLAASFDFGSANVVIALVIATIKASLVALFFMHLLHDKPMNSVVFVSGLVFLTIFLLLSLLDADTRRWAQPAPKAAAAPAAAAASSEGVR